MISAVLPNPPSSSYRFSVTTVRWLALFATVATFRCNAIFADEPRESSRAPAQVQKLRIVGYLPEYRADGIDPEIGRHLTDLIYFSAQASPEGDLKLDRVKPEHIAKLQAIKEKHHISLALCVGGWERSAGFAKVAASEARRRRFAAALVKFCTDHQFDGVDIDWEHPANEAEYRDYGKLLAAVKEAFRPHQFQLTIAAAGWQTLTAEAIQAVDRVHLMAYDAPGRHSTFEFAESDVARLMKADVPPAKICLGVPFYGKGIQDSAKALSYAQILAKFQPAPDVDEVDGVYYNGPKTMERKTQFARMKNLAGVMIWELGQDAPAETSLLRVIDQSAGRK